MGLMVCSIIKANDEIAEEFKKVMQECKSLRIKARQEEITESILLKVGTAEEIANEVLNRSNYSIEYAKKILQSALLLELHQLNDIANGNIGNETQRKAALLKIIRKKSDLEKFVTFINATKE